jgi:hypothetical protein
MSSNNRKRCKASTLTSSSSRSSNNSSSSSNEEIKSLMTLSTATMASSINTSNQRHSTPDGSRDKVVQVFECPSAFSDADNRRGNENSNDKGNANITATLWPSLFKLGLMCKLSDWRCRMALRQKCGGIMWSPLWQSKKIPKWAADKMPF